MSLSLTDNISLINGIGEKREKLFNKIGVFSLKDLITFYPKHYLDRTEVVKINKVILNDVCIICAKPIPIIENIKINNIIMTKVKLRDDTGTIDAIWFNKPYLKSTIVLGKTYYFTGRISKKYNNITIVSPEITKYDKSDSSESNDDSLTIGRIVPVYSGLKGLTQNSIRKSVRLALDNTIDNFDEILPENILEKYNFPGKKFAIENVHFPKNNESFIISRKRLVFEELFIVQCALFMFKNKLTKDVIGKKITDFECASQIKEKLKFKLTNAQITTLMEIQYDLKSGKAMNRLIQGDVGSGKTAIAIITCYIVIKNGYQAALMAPTEVLANQHFESIYALFHDLGVKCVLLTGSLTKKQKEEAYSTIASGKAHMIIGTHAVIQKSVIFNNLGIVITDEQHRFGVRQRAILSSKGKNPHVLVMTATPIPRTLALVLYGDLDISTIDKLPPGRKKIGTWAVTRKYRDRVYNFIKSEIAKGRQIYIICPLIENDDEKKDKSDVTVIDYYNYLNNTVFPHINTSYLHGKMKPKEKQEVMDNFIQGKISILVSTTVIEVGVNVPNATVVVVEDAEKFGLSQLHQLRGRVGRGEFESNCILISGNEDNVVPEKLKVIEKTNDGFLISEFDLKNRGPGDFFGTMQHGIPEMKIANLYKDIDVLKIAQKEAALLINDDKLFEKPHNSRITLEVSNYFNNITHGIYL